MLKLFVTLLRIFLYRLASLIRQCRIEILEMSQSSGMQSVFSAISSSKFMPGLPTDRSKRALLIILGLLIILLYMWPSWLRFDRQPINLSVEELCLNAKIQHLSGSIDSFNSVIDRKLSEDKHSYYPFVGNGYIGIGIEPLSKLHIKSQRTLSQTVNYHPVVTASLQGYEDKDMNVLEIENGLVYSVQCFPVEDTCLSITRYSYAHRTRPSLFVQDIRVSNPTNTGITLNWDHVGPSDWTGAESKIHSVPSRSGTDIKIRVTIGTVQSNLDPDHRVGVAVASTILPETLSVDKGSNWKESVLTAVQYADLSDPATQLGTLEAMVLEEMKTGLNVERKLLRREHSSVWRKVWKTGFSISRSLAKDALNGNRINATMYYVMSSVRAPIHELKDLGTHQDLEKLLYYSDRCYNGHHTLQNAKMWQTAEDMNSVHELVQIWLLTLEKQGCQSMLGAGLDGLVQAMVLSFGGLKFSNQHLEFNTEPKDLHRDFYFRRISYGNNTHLNISVVVGDDNKAQLYVSLDRNDKPYYACDAGCLDPPAKLTSTWTQFPVKLTKPMTSILYVTYDKIHMEELKHAIHVQEVNIAPAHEHHLMALHRHGHHYGGLPMLFWVCIGILIIIFHLFLFKLIFNEYCDRGDKYYTRGRYNL